MVCMPASATANHWAYECTSIPRAFLLPSLSVSLSRERFLWRSHSLGLAGERPMCNKYRRHSVAQRGGLHLRLSPHCRAMQCIPGHANPRAFSSPVGNFSWGCSLHSPQDMRISRSYIDTQHQIRSALPSTLTGCNSLSYFRIIRGCERVRRMTKRYWGKLHKALSGSKYSRDIADHKRNQRASNLVINEFLQRTLDRISCKFSCVPGTCEYNVARLLLLFVNYS